MCDYGSKTVKELKIELTKRAASTRGRKAELVERLLAYDRNHNFIGPVFDIPEDVEAAVDWPKFGFKEITDKSIQKVPEISNDQIEWYFLHQQALDQKPVNDIKAINKGKLLAESNHVYACSMYVENYIYLCGIVKASMKKKVKYNFKLKMDNSGDILNAACECVAGMGPHATCKHIAAVLITLQASKNNGTGIKESCTSKLQTFHQPKAAYNDSPIKTAQLPGYPADNCTDPRPENFKNMPGYDDIVRNKILNFCANENFDMTMRFLYSGASLYHASLDHTYEKLPFLEHWVDSALSVSEESASLLEKCTRSQRLSKQWFDERSWCVTASHFGAICRATCRRNMSSLCKSINSQKVLRTKAICHGIAHENKAIDAFSKIYQVDVKEVGLLVHPDMPFLGASPDGLVGNDYVVEVKCPYNGRQEKISATKEFSFLEKISTGEIQLKKCHPYYDQIQGQIYISQRRFCYFIVYTLVDIFIEVIPLDKGYCELSLLPKLELFYRKHYRPFIAKMLSVK